MYRSVPSGGIRDAGWHQATWDGRTNASALAGSGACFAGLHVGEVWKSARLVLIRRDSAAASSNRVTFGEPDHESRTFGFA